MENNPELDRIKADIAGMTPEQIKVAAAEMDASGLGKFREEDKAMAAENAKIDPQRQGDPPSA